MGKVVHRVVVVTGAAQGIGAAIAAAFSSLGHDVWTLDYAVADQERAVQVDVTDAAAVDAAISHVVKASGPIDVLVNAAGVYSQEPWGGVGSSDYRRIFDTNVLGTALMMQASMPHMPVGSSIVNIASVAGRRGSIASVLYAASKAAVINLTQSAALSFAPKVRVNAIAPGPVDTPMWNEVLRRGAAASGRSTTEVNDGLINAVPMKRIATTQDVAECVLFLAADSSSYITGQTVNVDGGLQLN